MTLIERTDVVAALVRAIRCGLMGEFQYRRIAGELAESPGSSMLVFGVGHDASLWSGCVSGQLTFVEDDPTYLTLAPANARVVLHQFPTSVGVWAPSLVPPSLIDTPWDFVLVDGPSGFASHCPGRQLPIMWAKQLATRFAFIHDYDRPWETPRFVTSYSGFRMKCFRPLAVPVRWRCFRVPVANSEYVRETPAWTVNDPHFNWCGACECGVGTLDSHSEKGYVEDSSRLGIGRRYWSSGAP